MKKEICVSEIAHFLCSEYFGEDIFVDGVNSFVNVSDNQVTFSKSKKKLENGTKCLILVPLDFVYDKNLSYAVIKVQNPRLSFIRVIDEFFIDKKTFSISKSSVIGRSCNLDESITIGENCVIGKNVTIKSGTVINHNVIISDNTIIGENCYIKSGSVIGEDGFGFERDENNIPIRFPHIGNVVIGNNVEIGCNTVIAKATLESTIIKDNVKIDDNVFIAHNVNIEENNIICACADISGSVKIGKNSWIGPNSSIIHGVFLGESVFIGIGALVTKNVKNGVTIIGNKSNSIEKYAEENNTLRRLKKLLEN
ncbi:DapH/DapD/GlmU-related protein [Halarcobacter sp.]|uniref:DapH/DapD/GlmU-related protein n=1 Tax=Halarcobacter sp. TaxID=2321133 RepID=UPI003AFFFE30